jgi:hypothetical protein
MSVSNSNVGDTTFKFVASDGGAPQKRRQVAKACESCRKRKKRCHHADPNSPRSSTVSSHVQYSPMSTPPSRTSQAALIDTQANPPGHQFPRSSGGEGEQYHTKTSLATSNPVERANNATEPEIVQVEVSKPNPVTQNQGGQNSRFIGDLNPEGLFLAATSPDATRGVSNDSIGVW